MTPWYRGFNGGISEVPARTGGRSYNCTGLIRQTGEATLEVTELPVGRWTQDYKDFLEGLARPKDKAEAVRGPPGFWVLGGAGGGADSGLPPHAFTPPWGARLARPCH